MKSNRSIRILVTGFGPFPHVRINPTAHVVETLAQRQQFRRTGIDIVSHVFPTRWSILAHDVERVIAQAKADAVLHLGVAARRNYIAIETVARLGSRRLLPDATGRQDAHTGPATLTQLRIAAPAEPLKTAIARQGAPVRLSNNAGRYLCNGIYVQSLLLRMRQCEQRPTLFIHVPMPAAKPGAMPKARVKTQRLSLNTMTNAIAATLPVLAACARRSRMI